LLQVGRGTADELQAIVEHYNIDASNPVICMTQVSVALPWHTQRRLPALPDTLALLDVSGAWCFGVKALPGSQEAAAPALQVVGY
jgi:hypothetical protein